jgi:hypothetical protein
MKEIIDLKNTVARMKDNVTNRQKFISDQVILSWIKNYYSKTVFREIGAAPDFSVTK